MQKVLKVFKSFEEAEKADREFYQSLSPSQRLEILLTLISRHQPPRSNEDGTGRKRVYRVIKRS